MFSKRWCLLATLLLLLLTNLPLRGHAQDTTDTDWQYWLFDTLSDHLFSLSPKGITEDIDLAAFTGFEADLIQRPLVAPDGHTLAFEVRLTPDTRVSGSGGLYLADLEAQECCRQLTDPENPTFIGFHRGPFSPDGTQIVVSMWADGSETVPMIAVFDMANGVVIHRLPVSELVFEPMLENETYEAAVFNEWSVDGIRLGGTCLNCPVSLIFFSHTQIWKPETGELSDPITVATDPLNLLATGELIISTFDETLPGGDQPSIGIGEGIGSIYPSNIVRYFPDHTQTQSEVIFNRPEPPMIQSAHWVVNGQFVLAYLDLEDSELRRAILLDRNGGQQTLEFFFDDQFFTPTPDGWLMCHYDNETSTTQIQHYQVVDGTFSPTSIAAFEGYGACSYLEIAGQNFVLGTGLDAPPFAP